MNRYAVQSVAGSPDEKWLFEADLYGATGGADHGGSGRCGIFGGFNAKGIGRTPLVSDNVDAIHKTGLMSLAEAIREVIISEICHSELPHGAVPILAVIDRGFAHSTVPNVPEERSAIVVRPNFIRPAHLERSIFFGDAGARTSHQYVDASRVAEAARAVSRGAGVYPGVKQIFSRLAEQLGAALAYRLWPGRFLTSNLSIDGAFVDFGAFRAVPSWRRCLGLAGECFGSETQQLRLGFASVLYYYAKYAEGDELDFNVTEFYNALPNLVQRAFLDACLEGLGVQRATFGEQPALEGLISAYYAQEQQMLEGDGPECGPSTIYTILSGGDCDGSCPMEIRRAQELIAELDRLQSAGFPVSRSRSMVFFAPRTSLNFATFNAEVEEFTSGLTHENEVETSIAAFVEAQFFMAIRSWRHLDPELEVIRYATDVVSSVLVCRDPGDGAVSLHLEGPFLTGHLHVLGGVLSPDALATPLSVEAGRAWFRQPLADLGQVAPVLNGLGIDSDRQLRRFGGSA